MDNLRSLAFFVGVSIAAIPFHESMATSVANTAQRGPAISMRRQPSDFQRRNSAVPEAMLPGSTHSSRPERRAAALTDAKNSQGEDRAVFKLISFATPGCLPLAGNPVCLSFELKGVVDFAALRGVGQQNRVRPGIQFVALK